MTVLLRAAKDQQTGLAAARVNGESRRQDLTMGGDRTIVVPANGGSRWDELSARGG